MLAFKGCARAMYQSWGVIGIGLSVFSLSPFGRVFLSEGLTLVASRCYLIGQSMISMVWGCMVWVSPLVTVASQPAAAPTPSACSAL
jgi:hypothetical protein